MNSVLLALVLSAPGFVWAGRLCAAFEAGQSIEVEHAALYLPRAKPVDPVYFQNMSAVARTFARWLRSSSLDQNFQLERLLSLQQRQSVAGDLADVSKRLESGTDQNSLQALVGLLRNEVPDDVVISAIDQVTMLSLATALEIASRFDGRIEASLPPPHDRILTSFVQIDGIPDASSRPYYERIGLQFRYVHPKSASVADYIGLMRESILRVRSLIRAKADSQVVLRELGRYYHLGIAGRPMVFHNDPILMVEVNTVLMALRLQPIYKGDIDLVVRALDSGAAELAFVDFVMKKQK